MAEVRRVHGRYADEVVARYRLCPFMRDAATGFGRFYVLLDREPALETALAAVEEADSAVVHLVFPLIHTPSPPFERFASRLGEQLRRRRNPAPVLAAFHPEMAGDETNSHRLVGLLRHAPDPFIQTIPEGLNHSGTVLAGAGVEPAADPAEDNFRRLQGASIAAVKAKLAEIMADRDTSYAPLLERLGVARPGPRFGPPPAR
ncbi:hypothetical protein [Sorangium cellulosum]|uniref:hypothetical protein n=1 Tax=Sorangium cellulosum TaxID=56 RepID=UPI001F5DA88E|nr:hypothetical protein [Sorangium cellulosum]